MKKFFSKFVTLFTFLALLITMSAPVNAEEGMWTFDNLPLKALKEKYGFKPDKAWIDHLRLASVRFNNGGSGSFITGTGLVMTNHHVAVEQLQKMSREGKDYLKEGFAAKTPADEIPCVDLELNVLTSMKDVTGVVEAAVKGKSEKEAQKARETVIGRLEKENSRGKDVTAQVVSLYKGGEYWLYVYRKYRDVRLVTAPPEELANFGGDYDNFTYPRYSLDFTIFRVYQDDKPLKSKYYLPITTDPVKDGQLIVVSGHPGATSRFVTFHRVEYDRMVNALHINMMDEIREQLDKYSMRGEEQARQARASLRHLNNSLKAYRGMQKSLEDPTILEKMRRRDEDLQEKVKKDPKLAKQTGDAWEEIETTFADLKADRKKLIYRRLGVSGIGRLPAMAQQVVFYGIESQKPEDKRLAEWHKEAIERWKFLFLSKVPIHKELEEAMLAWELETARQHLGADDPYVKVLLGGMEPADRAKSLVESTQLDDSKYRKNLVDGGIKAIKASNDPLIKLALKLEPMRREMKLMSRDKYRSRLAGARERIARARFQVYGKELYPDATFTLRMTYGTVGGYPYNGTIAPYKTTFYGLLDRYYSFDKKAPWTLPESFVNKMNKLQLSTCMNFVADVDTTGGNSGSPAVDRKLRMVGVLFDGNIEGLAGEYVFQDDLNRSVCVSAQAIMELLEKVYSGGYYLDEIKKAAR